MDQFFYLVAGDPIPYIHFKNMSAQSYDKYRLNKMMIRIQLENQHNNRKLIEGPLHVNMDFFFPIIQSCSEAVKKKMCGSFHQLRPDICQLVTYVELIARSIIYADDCVVASITSKKVYDNVKTGRTEITIRQL